MATIYRFIVEQKGTGGGGRNNTNSQSNQTKKQTAKRGRWVSLLGGEKGGVEHNRKMRAVNPLFNKAMGGWWEKGMRLGRAGSGLITQNTETGKLGISGPAIAIIIAFMLQMLMKWDEKTVNVQRNLNPRAFTMLENGYGSVHGQYSITTRWWDEHRTYNQNK